MTFEVVTLQLLEGFGTTVLLFVATLLLALPCGLIVTFGSMSKIAPIRYLARTVVWIIRGTPLMLQVMVVFYVPGLVFNYPMQSRFIAVLIAFVINYACYFSEIYRPVSPKVGAISFPCLKLGSKLTVLILTPPLKPTEKLWRWSCNCAYMECKPHSSNTKVTMICFFIYRLFKINFY